MKRRIGYKTILWTLTALVFALFWFSIPRSFFDKPYSTIAISADGTLLGARIATDGQWRFPASDSVPERFKQCLLLFEDRNFYAHNGVYLPALIRATKQNVTHGRVVSGGSTLTMQVVRLGRNNPARTGWEKMMEMVRALRIECTHSKDEILAMYAAHAPYGGNVVGLEAASWRYFGRSPFQLSWAESATLAVLPNAPSLIFPGKNQHLLLEKRNRVLTLLRDQGLMNDETYALSLLEPLPAQPFPLPQHARHALDFMMKKYGAGKRFETTLRSVLQQQLEEEVQRHMASLEANLVHNAAVLVVEVATGNVIAYVGNAHDASYRYSNHVDIIQSKRSTGSILKPFLYAAMLKDGLILPESLLPDVPMYYDGFTPKNYSETYDGAVPASKALSRSLNIPSVAMLKEYGHARFYHLLQKLPITSLHQPADHYGLSLILGGAEASLWDITHAYASMSRTLVHYHQSNGNYRHNEYERKQIIQQAHTEGASTSTPLLDAGSIWCTYKALLDVNKPETELGWDAYTSAVPIAWKTGTSFGNRDAWAVGTTPEYVIGVWVGNANGVGRPLLTGVSAAAPLLFDAFDYLPQRTWFYTPYNAMVRMEVCKQSGNKAGPYCGEPDTLWVPKSGAYSKTCQHHQLVFTDATGSRRMTAECAGGADLHPQHWFVLPAVQAHYYQSRHPEYKALPPMAAGCTDGLLAPIGLIYPRSDAPIYIPRGITGEEQRLVFEATHSDTQATLYWHLDAVYLGETRTIHQMPVQCAPGKHTLSLMDAAGHVLYHDVMILER
jgi:penicillin-binding protein 1C